MKFKNCLQPVSHSNAVSTTLLILRLIVGIAFIYHGWGKIQNPFGWIPAPTPVPGFFQFLAALSEFGGGIALILGLLTPIASLGLAFTMVVAVIFHGVVLGHPFVSAAGGPAYELAMVYLGISLLIMTTGPGKFSVDKLLFGKAN
jgi:putative oxidoreductase